jgi:hypothetical protein
MVEGLIDENKVHAKRCFQIWRKFKPGGVLYG